MPTLRINWDDNKKVDKEFYMYQNFLTREIALFKNLKLNNKNIMEIKALIESIIVKVTLYTLMASLKR